MDALKDKKIIEDNSTKENIFEEIEAVHEELNNPDEPKSSKPPGLFYKLKNSKFVSRASQKTWPILLPFIIVMIFLIILPLIGIVVYSIIQPTNNSLVFKLSLENFVKLFSDSNIMIAMLLSIAYALVAAFCCVIIGYPIAYIMAQLKSKILAKNVWVLVTMPIWISMLLKVLGLQTLFYVLAPTALGTPIAIIIGMVYMFLPFCITPIYNSLESSDKSQLLAAKDLGASNSKAFFQFTLRQSMGGVLAGFSLVIIQAATSLIVIRYLGDGKINLIASIIESYFFKGSNFGYGAAISVVLAILIGLLMLVMKLISNKFEGGSTKKWKGSSRQAISQ
ncbi:spermidine/putrescine ABC transporter permease [Spiroplasma sabaudiense Ar-1343]|uniref:Spermidine/putrescine ABC transporter permease n=1 Tax=Spiroplasma sabaudiense Ar-1343 TaxID=1276257 RepID=W6AIK1_9MOLU|nr:spermidine/putrescine ABC transporter permease [Spiroplasma sabaudiense]AHI53534.1 spermidine/putrescine ABC transporter permease [Spiroplasma sabaudiense Ar-1343]